MRPTGPSWSAECIVAWSSPMNRSLAGFLAVLIASHLATALCAPAGVGLHDLPAPASFPELFAEPPTVGAVFAPEAAGTQRSSTSRG